jgi:DNA-binding HxlR family transcriptional regulator
VEYSLTAKGRALVPLIEQMRLYGQQWLMNGKGGAVNGAAPDEAHAKPVTAPVAAGHTQAA